MSELPEGWERTKLGEVASTRGERAALSALDERLYVGLDAVAPGSTEIAKWQRAAEFSSSAVQFRTGDILYSRLRPYLNKVCVADRDGVASSEFIVLRSQSEVDPRFLMYLIHSEKFVSFTSSLAGGDRPRVKWSQIAEFPISLPPHQEQVRIVAAIEEHLSYLDVAKANLGRCAGRMDALRASAITEVLAGCDAPSVAWGEVGVTLSGRAFPSTAYTESGCRLLRPGNLHRSGSVVWSPKASTYLPMSFADEHPKYLLRGVHLLMNLTAQSLADDFLGRVCLSSTTDSFLLNQRIARLSSPVASADYLYWVFRARPFRRFVAGLNTGSLIQHISTRHLATFTFPLPSAEEQTCVVAEIQERIGAIDRLERTVLSARDRQPVVRRALLAAAFSGQLVPQDRGDEPASTLLERIVAERAAAIPAKRKRKVTAS